MSEWILWKAALKRRLQAEGTWKDFIRVRESLKDGGMDERDAWLTAAGEEVPERNEPTDALASDFADKAASEPESVRWVADNISVKGVKPSDAPSAAAWGLLQWAKSSVTTKDRFFTQVYTRLMPSGKQLEDEGRFRDDGEGIIELCGKVEAEILEALEGGEAS